MFWVRDNIIEDEAKFLNATNFPMKMNPYDVENSEFWPSRLIIDLSVICKQVRDEWDV